MGETGGSEGLVDDRPRCSDLDEHDPLLEQLKRHHEIVGGRVRERVVAEGAVEELHLGSAGAAAVPSKK
jgi:hypothetical protein